MPAVGDGVAEATMSYQPLSEQFELDARCDQPFLVLTLAAGAIATLGLLANSSAVVIGAMLIAPWMLPLRAAAFGILQGRLLLVGRALLTLLIGLGMTVVLSVLLCVSVGLPILGSEVAARTQPNLLDLGVALVGQWRSLWWLACGRGWWALVAGGVRAIARSCEWPRAGLCSIRMASVRPSGQADRPDQEAWVLMRVRI